MPNMFNINVRLCHFRCPITIAEDKPSFSLNWSFLLNLVFQLVYILQKWHVQMRFYF